MKQQAQNPRELYDWIRRVIAPGTSLGELLESVTMLNADVPKVGNALVRADLDVPIADNRVTDTARLESASNTLHLLWHSDIVPILFGHVGRAAINTASPIAEALTLLYDCEVRFIPDWFSDDTYTRLSDGFIDALKSAKGRSLILLENTRKYEFEQHLWEKGPEDMSTVDLDLLSVPAQTLSQATLLYVSDAIASSNPDWSSLVLPFYAHDSYLAQPVAKEFKEYILPCTRSNVLVFSGLKADKLDDLERITASGLVRFVIVGGALAFPFLVVNKAMAGDESHKLLKSRRVRQAKSILKSIQANGGTILLPIDFVDSSGKVRDTISSPSDMLDIGPKTIETYSEKLTGFARKTEHVSIYMNGVLGKVEDEAFQAGTISMFDLLRKVRDLGAKVYVGGGDGAAALRQFGDEKDVEHVFTAGGTVLKATSGRPISFLSSLAAASSRMRRNSG